MKLFADELESVKVNLLDTVHLKSNNYYLMSIIPKLKNLRVLKVYKQLSYAFGKNGVNFLQKALNYLTKNGGSIKKFEFGHGIDSINEDFFFGYLKQMPELIVLKINDYPLMAKDTKAIGKFLSNYNSIKELDLSRTSMSTDVAKEIADGLMRAKNIEILKMTGNQKLNCSQMIYNLAFSPKIKHIDMTASCTKMSGSTSTGNDWKSVVEMLYKLLKINSSIETILFGQTKICAYFT